MRGLRRILMWLVTLPLVIVLGTNLWVYLQTANRVHDSVDTIEQTNVALVLGTSKRVVGGQRNWFFEDRIQAAANLYHEGKVKHILVSGDNRTKYYNEPKDMRDALLDLGIPRKDITLDYAGLRTLDSIVRSKVVFGQEKLIVVTQRFHSYRALFISDYEGIQSQVYAADFNSSPHFSLIIREILARTLSVFDLYLFDTSPKYGGEKEKLPIKVK